ncbi:Ig-like domain-containing protein [Parapedobacter sp. ISTM3]|uniref:Ig-like domain-containing protein n=1 Tax=Parapedobacter sp. ISTM3 TaxID=2800130 RepID=UPI00190883E0|nr:Ig-like domain-containing protein [Parapedobacter sp. ISTM3]MBK1440654.1 Ig-like domain-containing protein [Parapedobacter sp. ISTM3]
MQESSKIKTRSNRLKIGSNPKWGVFAFFTGLILLTWQCASIQQPTGGPRDSIPPKIINETPPNLTRNFNAEKIVIEFDEYIRLTNPLREISVSPDIDQPISPRVRRRNIEIELPDSLAENTTYTINFGKAIGDFNENNPLLNYSYVFSTGDIIDSLAVSGKVINALTKLSEKEVTVMLIPTRQDSIFGKRKANIFTLTDTAGNFQFRNLREDTYHIYALKEENNDRVYNDPSELIGFLNDSITLAQDTSGILLQLSRGIARNFRLLDRKLESNGRLTFAFNKPLENPEIIITYPPELNEDKQLEYSVNRDSAVVWLNDLTFDSLKVRFLDDGNPLDSVTMRRGRNEKYDRDFIITDNLTGNRVNRIRHIELTAGSPVQAIDRSKIILLEDSIPRTNFQLARDTVAPRRFILRYNWRPKRNYSLTFEEGAFSGYFGDKSKSVTRSFTLDETENFGDIILKVNVPDTTLQYLVQVTNEKMDFVYRSVAIRGPSDIPFRQMPGGKYTVRIVYDENFNGKWDPGNVYERRQPERVWYIGKTFIIRANWEQEETINVPK